MSTAFHVVCNPTGPIYLKIDLDFSILLLVQIDRTSRDMAFDLYNHSHCWKDITGHVFVEPKPGTVFGKTKNGNPKKHRHLRQDALWHQNWLQQDV